MIASTQHCNQNYAIRIDTVKVEWLLLVERGEEEPRAITYNL